MTKTIKGNLILEKDTEFDEYQVALPLYGAVPKHKPLTSWKEKCEYCFKIKKDCKEIQLRNFKYGESDWQKPIEACKECRTYLKGVFKYARTPHDVR